MFHEGKPIPSCQVVCSRRLASFVLTGAAAGPRQTDPQDRLGAAIKILWPMHTDFLVALSTPRVSPGFLQVGFPRYSRPGQVRILDVQKERAAAIDK